MKCEFRLLLLSTGKVRRCGKDATVEVNGKHYCKKHALRYIERGVEDELQMFIRSVFEEKETKECKCDMRTKLVGDGCDVCNPDLAKELEKDADEERSTEEIGVPDGLYDNRETERRERWTDGVMTSSLSKYEIGKKKGPFPWLFFQDIPSGFK